MRPGDAERLVALGRARVGVGNGLVEIPRAVDFGDPVSPPLPLPLRHGRPAVAETRLWAGAVSHAAAGLVRTVGPEQIRVGQAALELLFVEAGVGLICAARYAARAACGFAGAGGLVSARVHGVFLSRVVPGEALCTETRDRWKIGGW